MMQQQIFWFLCDQVRFLGKYAKIFGETKNMRNYADDIELCGLCGELEIVRNRTHRT